MSWRFALLLGLALLDAVVFLVPVVASALVLAAVVSPDGLRWTARFLDALAGDEVADDHHRDQVGDDDGEVDGMDGH